MKNFIFILLLIPFASKADYLTSLEKSNRLDDKTLFSVLDNRTEYKNTLKDLSSDKYTSTLSTALIAWELSDGVNGIETADILMVAWLNNPTTIASWFDSKQSSQQRWLKSQDYLFNGFAEPDNYQTAEKLRLDMLGKLKSLQSTSSTITLYIKVLEKLVVPKYN